LAAGRGAVAFPVLRALAGVALILDGVFSQDPAGDYPPGAATTHTLAGQLHTAFAALAIGTLAASWFVLARRLKAEPGWRAWAPAAVLTGVLSLAFIMAFGAAGAHGGVAGLFERLAGAVDSLLGLALVVALLARLRAKSTGTVER
jgi:4-amino-4-deoxy-L-arabinose transferase-like glycosyltransferase